MIAGHHDDADAGAPAVLNGVRHVLPRRILQRDEAEKRQVVIGRGVGARTVLAGAGQHAQTVLAEMFDARAPFRPRRVFHDDVAVFRSGACASCQNGFRRAFDGEQKLLAVAVHGRHHLAGAIEGVLARDRQRIQQRVAADAGSAAGAQQRKLHRIAARVFRGVAERGVVAKHRHVEQADNLRIVGEPPPGGRMGCYAAVQFDFARCDPEPAHRHPVFGQRAGLVGENDRGRAQRFDRRQPFDQRVLPRHAPHAARERQCRHDRQALRDRGDRERYRRFDDEEDVIAAPQADAGDDHGQDDSGPDQLRGEPCQLLLQRRASRFGLFDELRDAPELGVQAGRRDDAGAAAAGDRGALEKHRTCVRPVARRRRRRRPAYGQRRIRRSASIYRRRGWTLRSAADRRRSNRRLRCSTMSPGTSSSAAMSRVWPSRRTRAERVPSARKRFDRARRLEFGQKADQRIDGEHGGNRAALFQFAESEGERPPRRPADRPPGS